MNSNTNSLNWFEIPATDMKRAKKFYESVFQVRLEKLNSPEIEMWAFPMNMERSGASGSLVRMQGVMSGGNSVLVYFSCADCASEVARIRQAGGRVHKDKLSIGQYGFIALAYDTEGNLFGLHSLS